MSAYRGNRTISTLKHPVYADYSIRPLGEYTTNNLCPINWINTANFLWLSLLTFATVDVCLPWHLLPLTFGKLVYQGTLHISTTNIDDTKMAKFFQTAGFEIT